MPIPRHSAELPSVQLQLQAACTGVTELRVHGVGGSSPDAILGDLAPEQVSGDAIAGFYRSTDHRASDADREAGLDADMAVPDDIRSLTAEGSGYRTVEAPVVDLDAMIGDMEARRLPTRTGR